MINIWCHRLFIFLLLLTVSHRALGQTSSAIDRLNQLETQYGVKIFYDTAWLEGFSYDGNSTNSLEAALADLFDGSSLEYVLYQKQVIIFPKAKQAVTNQPRIHKLRGELSDFISERPLAGAQVTVQELDTSTVTDNRGKFEIDLPQGQYTVKSQFVGFEDYLVKVKLQSDTLLKLSLSDKLLRLEGVTVTDRALDANVKEVQVGKIELSMIEINQAPSATGEVDIIQGVVALPGITTAGEGATGFNVRGGSTGQNLVLLDKAVIYNPYHLFGIVSAFDANTINQVTMYKAALPAEYGGRLSSVLDISADNGNEDAIGVTGAVGVLLVQAQAGRPYNRECIVPGGRKSLSF